ncbi:hypothetical protein T265_06861 [Opisthorchis viverrini]|uniref:Uncharacterized protein n=1 Tax=Opisthorchis viverrini TaxID=6198 RepID=A0A074ZQZ6_OPIVI|nr:hypothetical protein T265_06861 [Opisthorchis viverrini]KER25760.1 hypothetical protein T265_06861 [Opisthorchis viverrini]
MRLSGAAHSVAWKHHKREIQLGSSARAVVAAAVSSAVDWEGQADPLGLHAISATLGRHVGVREMPLPLPCNRDRTWSADDVSFYCFVLDSESRIRANHNYDTSPPFRNVT